MYCKIYLYFKWQECYSLCSYLTQTNCESPVSILHYKLMLFNRRELAFLSMSRVSSDINIDNRVPLYMPITFIYELRFILGCIISSFQIYVLMHCWENQWVLSDLINSFIYFSSIVARFTNSVHFIPMKDVVTNQDETHCYRCKQIDKSSNIENF